MKKNQKKLNKELESALRKIKVGALYSHYKNPKRFYRIKFLGFLESTEEVCVGYRSIYGKGILWVRTLKNFTERVEVNGKKIPRFKYLGK